MNIVQNLKRAIKTGVSVLLMSGMLVSCMPPSLNDRFAELEEYCENGEFSSIEEAKYFVEEYKQLVTEFAESYNYLSESEKREIIGRNGRIIGIMAGRIIRLPKEVRDIVLELIEEVKEGFEEEYDPESGEVIQQIIDFFNGL